MPGEPESDLHWLLNVAQERSHDCEVEEDSPCPSSSSSSHRAQEHQLTLTTSKRKFASDIHNDNEDESGQSPELDVEPHLFDIQFPKNYETILASAIYELGLKISSPKVLLSLMPKLDDLTTEHIKSHLQKYRIHKDRSRAEFLDYFENIIKDKFDYFERCRGWERDVSDKEKCDDFDGMTNNTLHRHTIYFILLIFSFLFVQKNKLRWLGRNAQKMRLLKTVSLYMMGFSPN